MKNYFLKYWTTEGTIIGLNVCAMSEFDALAFAQQYPNYKTLCEYPMEVHQ